MKNTFYEIQYANDKNRLWIHSSEGETVARFDTRFGMDIHRPMCEQINGAGQCLHCTHEKPTKSDFDSFSEKVKALWGVVIDKSQINI